MNEHAKSAVYQPLHRVSLYGAKRVITAAQDEARRHHWHISVAVVDNSGHLVAFEKDDQAIGISIEVAWQKARTAALLQAPSKEFEDFINNGHPSFLGTPGVTPLEGGVPLQVAGKIIGAVGISGAHGANDSLVAKIAATAVNNEDSRDE